jgi:hypothetical protein
MTGLIIVNAARRMPRKSSQAGCFRDSWLTGDVSNYFRRAGSA